LVLGSLPRHDQHPDAGQPSLTSGRHITRASISRARPCTPKGSCRNLGWSVKRESVKRESVERDKCCDALTLYAPTLPRSTLCPLIALPASQPVVQAA
jgi:hypothetical protein